MLVDAHCHLNMYQYRRFGYYIGQVLERIRRSRILTITNSIDLASYRANVKIADSGPVVYKSFGIHPWNAHRYHYKLEEIAPVIDENRIIGEIGLDYHWVKDRGRYEAQRRVFQFFLKRCAEKPISVHTKGAENDCLDLLNEYGCEKVLIHWYSGGMETLDSMVDSGFFFTVGPQISISDHIERIARRIPLGRLLTETDNPEGVEWLFGRTGTPEDIKGVLKRLSEVKGRSLTQMENIVQNNSIKFFGLDKIDTDRVSI